MAQDPDIEAAIEKLEQMKLDHEDTNHLHNDIDDVIRTLGGQPLGTIESPG